MKVSCFTLLALVASSLAAVHKGEDKTITKVVKLLQDMLEKSKEEGKTEKNLYGKFKCYCDTNDAEKTTQIASLAKTIGLLESSIESIQASNGELSAQAARLKTDMAENVAARESATNIRTKENVAFTAEETDLKAAVGQMGEAIKVLSEIGGDQTLGSAQDNKQFMAGYKGPKPLLMALGSEVKNALAAASIFLNPQQKKQMNSFLQAPFTGTYSSQSGQVVGILKDMKATFETNLAEAVATETKDAKSHELFMTTKKSAFDSMESTFTEKQTTLGANDEALTSKKSQLQAATKDKADAEEFQTKLTDMCAKKATEYDERNLSRANEDAAIAEAISILNSDQAFSTFGTVSATSTGATKAASFLQLRRSGLRSELERVLKVEKSTRLMRVLAAVEAGNPFEKVLIEIEKMKTLNNEEAKEDKKNLDWCSTERTENEKSLQDRKDEIVGLDGDINTLTTSINDPVQGLKNQIKESETNLIQNNAAQGSETTQRTENNVAYQADIRNLVDADDLLTKAISVLSRYYQELEKKIQQDNALVQEDPDPPATWDTFKGQSTKGKDAVSMLEFILGETKKEEFTAHTEEEKAQASYEDSMAELKKEQAGLEQSLVKLGEDLASAEKSLVEKNKDLKITKEAQAKIEEYLLKIKPGCDFITTNFDTREANRKIETDALAKAVTLIKATPAYTAAVQSAKHESFGKCKELCVADEVGAKCKACLADVTVPAYCAGHKGTSGC